MKHIKQERSLPKRSVMKLNFEPISLDKQTDYLKLLADCPEVASDYSFLNIWAWAEDYGLRWALKNVLFFSLRTYSYLFNTNRPSQRLVRCRLPRQLP